MIQTRRSDDLSDCAAAKTELRQAVVDRERDELQSRLEDAARACKENPNLIGYELEGHTGSALGCDAALEQLEQAAARRRTPTDVDSIVEIAVRSCVGIG